MSQTEPLLTPDQAADILGLPAATLRQWRYLGRGPAFCRLGRHVRYLQRDLDTWIASQRVDPQPAA